MNDQLAPPFADESLIPVFRALGRCQSAIDRLTGPRFEALGLTPAQFDVLATLGDTSGMSCKELGERTLITRGTLSPVLDRLEAKGLITRAKGTNDCRQTFVTLTAEGQVTYERTFMPHVVWVKQYIDKLTPAEQAQLVSLLDKLQSAFLSSTTT
ncbi:MAG: MarR family transcriptional regulator [Cyanobacteria bacterium NC_groundwater_1444_Ag_S-0.65um_54_12]|nr:MarR family transcriptional regulator [Cyanobacteria bacterium NC_groundwater_1444_Ag_S-0.65um_54_12]